MDTKQPLWSIEILPSLSRQEIFDMTACHLLRTGCKSVRRDGMTEACVYGGSGCAASPFLKPEHRTQADMLDPADGKTWGGLVDDGLVSDHEHLLIIELQAVHDYSSAGDFKAVWLGRMRQFALTHDLDPSVLDQGFHPA